MGCRDGHLGVMAAQVRHRGEDFGVGLVCEREGKEVLQSPFLSTAGRGSRTDDMGDCVGGSSNPLSVNEAFSSACSVSDRDWRAEDGKRMRVCSYCA